MCVWVVVGCVCVFVSNGFYDVHSVNNNNNKYCIEYIQFIISNILSAANSEAKLIHTHMYVCAKVLRRLIDMHVCVCACICLRLALNSCTVLRFCGRIGAYCLSFLSPPSSPNSPPRPSFSLPTFPQLTNQTHVWFAFDSLLCFFLFLALLLSMRYSHVICIWMTKKTRKK